MDLNAFLSMDGEFSLSSDEARQLNRILSTASLLDIPQDSRVKVSDYLIMALNMNSVENHLIDKLDNLLKQLQDCL